MAVVLGEGWLGKWSNIAAAALSQRKFIASSLAGSMRRGEGLAGSRSDAILFSRSEKKVLDMDRRMVIPPICRWVDRMAAVGGGTTYRCQAEPIRSGMAST